MTRLKCAAEGCQEFAQAGTDYCQPICRKAPRRAMSALPSAPDPVTTQVPARPMPIVGMFDSTEPRRVHRSERRANGCNQRPKSNRL